MNRFLQPFYYEHVYVNVAMQSTTGLIHRIVNIIQGISQCNRQSHSIKTIKRTHFNTLGNTF